MNILLLLRRTPKSDCFLLEYKVYDGSDLLISVCWLLSLLGVRWPQLLLLFG